MKILVDSSLIIDFLRVKDNTTSLFYQLSAHDHDLSVSIITQAELYSGKSVWEKPDVQAALETIFSGLTIVPLDSTVAVSAGQIRAAHGTDLIDALLAATALRHGLTVATLNRKDFAAISGISLLDEHASAA
jgi:predicted nucleic acid-binding protein